MSNFTNGDSNTYTMTTYSPLPHFTGDILQFEFPVEVILPPTVVCVPLGILTVIECWRVGTHLVRGRMSFIDDFIEVDTEIKF